MCMGPGPILCFGGVRVANILERLKKNVIIHFEVPISNYDMYSEHFTIHRGVYIVAFQTICGAFSWYFSALGLFSHKGPDSM